MSSGELSLPSQPDQSDIVPPLSPSTNPSENPVTTNDLQSYLSNRINRITSSLGLQTNEITKYMTENEYKETITRPSAIPQEKDDIWKTYVSLVRADHQLQQNNSEGIINVLTTDINVTQSLIDQETMQIGMAGSGSHEYLDTLDNHLKEIQRYSNAIMSGKLHIGDKSPNVTRTLPIQEDEDHPNITKTIDLEQEATPGLQPEEHEIITPVLKAIRMEEPVLAQTTREPTNLPAVDKLQRMVIRNVTMPNRSVHKLAYLGQITADMDIAYENFQGDDRLCIFFTQDGSVFAISNKLLYKKPSNQQILQEGKLTSAPRKSSHAGIAPESKGQQVEMLIDGKGVITTDTPVLEIAVYERTPVEGTKAFFTKTLSPLFTNKPKGDDLDNRVKDIIASVDQIEKKP